ncbi:MAG TPA: flagellar biosynthesis anti-sigma factor FlgM [Blastocatellia bacterium]|nr:flagellar biosynthesis anti-sigma factor FlgM [Blastocatellia bacterium]
MNPINLSGPSEIDPRRATGRIEAERPVDVNTNPPRTGTGSAQNSDSVDVSDRAAAIGELTAKADQLPEVRQEKVERLRTQVETGNYRPPASDIAEALLKEGTKPGGEI